MESGQLHSELLESGERLFRALACEHEANAFSAAHLNHNWHGRLRTIRREVRLAAEDYALALKSYRLATLSEFASAEVALSVSAARMQKRRETPQPAAGSFRNGRSHAIRSTRPDVAPEGFAISTRRAKLK